MNSARYIYVLIGMISLLAVGWRNTISVFYQYLMDVYGVESVFQIAAYIAVASSVGVVTSPLFGAIYDKRGPSIPLTIGAVSQTASGVLAFFMKSRPWGEAIWFWYAAAVAAGFVFPSVVTSVNPTVMKSIKSSPQLALAVAQTGSYMALTFWSPLITCLIPYVGPIETYSIASLITTLVLGICAVAYRGVKPQSTRTSNAISSSRWRIYSIMLVSIFLIATSSIAILSYLAPIASEICVHSGISRGECILVYTPAVMSAAGVLQSIGGFFWGFLAAKTHTLTTIFILYLTKVFSSLATVYLSSLNSWLAILTLLLRLFAFGGEPVVHMVIIPVLLGGESIGKALGLQISVVMLSSIVGPSIGGIIRDVSGSYILTVAGSAILTTSALLPLLAVSYSSMDRYVKKTRK